ncbi:MAG: hypothetical protein BRD55_06710 [Bacteroidetes bacterium SW_9_63_38]|nr:MAG: hypothetical protein BRD55_06710 [Bacteroidetes bacterium SW_9_63_38]
MAHDTIEIYVRNLSEEEAVAWLRDVLETVEQDEDALVLTYEGTYEGETVPVQIAEEVENGPYTSVWLNAPTMPWDTATACARDAHEALGREGLCFLSDPEQPWTLLQVSDEGEAYVQKEDVAL